MSEITDFRKQTIKSYSTELPEKIASLFPQTLTLEYYSLCVNKRNHPSSSCVNLVSGGLIIK